MNILLWVLQALLAAHTAIGAIWKFSHSAEQTMPILKAIPPGLWIAMAVLELICSVGLIVPALRPSLSILAPIAAICIGAEMLFFTGLQISSGQINYGPIIYWLIVAAFCAVIAYGRLKP